MFHEQIKSFILEAMFSFRFFPLSVSNLVNKKEKENVTEKSVFIAAIDFLMEKRKKRNFQEVSRHKQNGGAEEREQEKLFPRFII